MIMPIFIMGPFMAAWRCSSDRFTMRSFMAAMVSGRINTEEMIINHRHDDPRHEPAGAAGDFLKSAGRRREDRGESDAWTALWTRSWSEPWLPLQTPLGWTAARVVDDRRSRNLVHRL
jgi:hypothetical protein